MISLELIAYIEHQKSNGINDADILKTLIAKGGWDKSDIHEALGIVNLPKGTIQAAQFRAARIRSETQTKTRHSLFGKVIAFLLLVVVIGGGVAFFMSTKENQQQILDYTKNIPGKVQNEYIPQVLALIGKASTSTPAIATSTIATSTIATSTIATSTIATSTSVAVATTTDCGSFTYSKIEDGMDAIAHSTCFIQSFKTCGPANMAVTINDYKTTFNIIGKKDGFCTVDEEISGASLTNPQRLICQFTGNDWKAAQDDSARVCKVNVM